MEGRTNVEPANADRLRTSVAALRRVVLSLALALSIGCPVRASAQAAPAAVLSDGPRFSQRDGESLYRAVCQSCHMADGQGAKGAGAYPALASDPRLAASAYPVINVLHGRKGMPAFGEMLSDDQVAQVTNYVRTHLGNRYTDAVSPADVAALRRAP